MRGVCFGVTAVAASLLAACGASGPDNASGALAPSPDRSTAAGVRLDKVSVPAPTTTSAPAAAIQSQPGPNGSTVALTKVAVTGDILTVAMTYSGGKCCDYVNLEQVSLIDDATSRRIGVLKDNAGHWMAAPLGAAGDRLQMSYSGDGPVQVWLKFPAPPASSRTVSIAMPEVAPFDSVTITR